MFERLKSFFRYKRQGLYFEKMFVTIDEIQYNYEIAFKVKELNVFATDSLVDIIGIYSMDRRPLGEVTKSYIMEKAPKILKTNDIHWELSSEIKKENDGKV
jgi:hypothetical protein